MKNVLLKSQDWFTDKIGHDVDRFEIATNKCIRTMQIINLNHAVMLFNSQDKYYYEPMDESRGPVFD